MNAKERVFYELGAALISYADGKRTPDQTERAIAFLRDFADYSLRIGIHSTYVADLLRNPRWRAVRDENFEPPL